MRSWAIAALALGGASGCAAAAPPRDLTDAQRVLARAETGPFAELAEAEIQDAEAALAEAEREAFAEPGSTRAADSAYVALRAAERARIAARCGAEREALSKARHAVARLEELEARRARERAEEARRREAEARAQAAFWAAQREAVERARSEDDIVVQQDHALVVRMPDAELFWPGTSLLRPSAEAHLAALARALPASPRGMLRVTALVDVAGLHLDAARMTRRRAQHVLDVLRASGVPRDAILPAARHPPAGVEVDIEVTEPPALGPSG
jgi:outer membrane protein OmpA-like peptidoglycan-associated protein